ncbi:MAG: hypothetical protein EBX35_15730, partial [Planctomycetia bacterium]|nr:hypothetical protein [Planctomycetia bacterium]
MRLTQGKVYDVSALQFAGWTTGDGTGADGYRAGDYFDSRGVYLGPDEHGIEPVVRPARTVTVYQLAHNGACWEHIEGASWSMAVAPGVTVADALVQAGPGGDWPDDDDARVGFVVRDDDDEDICDEDGDSLFVFTAGELRAGALAEECEEVDEPPVAIEVAECAETIRICGGLDELVAPDHLCMADACAAYRAAAVAALADDPRARRLAAGAPRGQRVLHLAWAGARWSYSCGAIATMAALTEAEQAA